MIKGMSSLFVLALMCGVVVAQNSNSSTTTERPRTTNTNRAKPTPPPQTEKAAPPQKTAAKKPYSRRRARRRRRQPCIQRVTQWDPSRGRRWRYGSLLERSASESVQLQRHRHEGLGPGAKEP